MSLRAKVRRSLTLEVTLTIVVLAVLVIGTIGVVQIRATRHWLGSVQEEEARRVTATLAAAVESMLEPDGVLSASERGAAERLIANTARSGDVADVALVDARQAVLAHALPDQALPPTLWASVGDALAGGRTLVTRDPLGFVTALRTVGRAGAPAPASTVALYVRAAPSSVSAFVSEMAWQIGMAAAGVAGLGTVVALAMLSRLVLQPTRALAGQAERLAAGDLEARSGFAARSDGDELVRLGQALDGMAARITGDLRRLRASEASSREVIERAGDGIFTSDEQGRVLDVNPAACALMRRSREEIIGVRLADTVHPDEVATLRAVVAGLAPGDVVVREWRLRTGDDSYRPVEVSAILLPDGRLQGITRDITTRKHAEDELRGLARQQRSVAELGQRALARVDVERLMADAVGLVASGLGVPLCHVLEILPDGSALRVRAAVGWPDDVVEDLVRSDRTCEAGFALHADGTVVADDLRTETRFQPSASSVAAGAVSALSVVIGSDREPFGVLAAHATERRAFTPGDVHFVETAANVLGQAIAHMRTDEALRASELRYRLAARATRDAMYDWDIAGDRLFWSEGIALLFGHAPGEIGSGISWWQDYIHPDDRERVVRSVDETFRDQIHSWRAEYRFRCADGSYKAVHDRAYIEYGAAGRPLRAVGAMTDVSEQQRAEADVRRQAGFVRLAHEVAIAANGSVDVAETMEAILRLVCEHLQWSVGHALLLHRIERLTPPPSVWHLTDHARFAVFAASTEARPVERGIGMNGRVWAQAQPAWFAVDDGAGFTRREAALAAGLRGGVAFPVLIGAKVVGILEFFSEHATAPARDVMAVIAGIATQLGRVIERARAEEDLRDYTERLETLSRRLLQAQETERRHVACELHDEIGQALTALKLNLQNVMAEIGRGVRADVAEAMMGESIVLVEETLQQTRNLSLDLRPAVLDDLGLVPALRWCLSRQGERAGFKTEFVSDVDDIVPSDVATTCFRIAQEALTNVARHARTTRVKMALTKRDKGIELVIRDFGRGFDRDHATARAEGGKSLGLLSMGERAALIGGTLTIDSTVGMGTVVRAQLPLRAA